MKGMKKLLSILMVLTLVLSLGATAFAATVEITDSKTGLDTDHNYMAYQVLKGEQTTGDTSDEGVLSNIEWGDGVDVGAFVQALIDDTTLGTDFANILSKDGKSAAKELSATDPQVARNVAKVLSGFGTDEAKIKAFGKLVLAHKGTNSTPLSKGSGEVDTGYYVIEDVTTGLEEGEVMNDIVVEVVGDLKIAPKNEGPESKKKVQDVNDSTGDKSDWQDSADYDIGDEIPYQLTVDTNDISAYDEYFANLYDVMSKGLELVEGSVKITVNGQDVTNLNVFKYEHGDIGTFKASKDDSIKIPEGVAEKYSEGTWLSWKCDNIKGFADYFKANADGSYEIVIEYKARLTEDAIIGPGGNPNTFIYEYNRNPNGDQGGHTPWDTNIVFTYNFDTNKVDEDHQPLEGAEFKLLKKQFTAPADADLATNATADIEKITDADIEYYYDGTYYWSFVDLKVTDGNVFTGTGMDDGEYKLVETKTPAGYNSIDPIDFTIHADHDVESADPQLTKLENGGADLGEFTFTKDNDTNGGYNVKGDVVNQGGVTLPETGGIGTTIFYIVGAVLVAGAVILLVTKKRVNGMEK